MAPGGDGWLRLMTASKVAAVLGLSPWESPFSLYHRMAGTAPAKEATPETERGHYLEPAIVKWWSDQHPEFHVEASRDLFYAKDNPRHAASPDALIYDTGHIFTGVLEVKTAARADEWGTPGTDEIPPYYRAQVLWQAYVLDVPRVHVAVLTGFLEFREYVVERDEDDLALIHEAVAAFLASLDEGRAPDIDSSSATYEVVRALHPQIDGSDKELDGEYVYAWLDARDQLATAKTTERHLNSLLLNAMGDAKRGLVGGEPVVRRTARMGGTPYLAAIKSKETS
jgi:putative phage-type endonuclease